MKRRSPVVCLAFSGGLDTTYCAAAPARGGEPRPRRDRGHGRLLARRERTIAARAKAREGGEARLRGRPRARSSSVRAAAPLWQRPARRGVSALRGGRARRAGAGGRRATRGRVGADGDRRTARRPPATTSSASTPALRVLAPEIEVRAPIRDGGVSREEETAYCANARRRSSRRRRRATPSTRGSGARRSAGGETHDSWEMPPEELYPGQHPGEGAEAPRDGHLGFDEGRPVALDGKPADPIALVERLNARRTAATPPGAASTSATRSWAPRGASSSKRPRRSR